MTKPKGSAEAAVEAAPEPTPEAAPEAVADPVAGAEVNGGEGVEQEPQAAEVAEVPEADQAPDAEVAAEAPPDAEAAADDPVAEDAAASEDDVTPEPTEAEPTAPRIWITSHLGGGSVEVSSVALSPIDLWVEGEGFEAGSELQIDVISRTVEGNRMRFGHGVKPGGYVLMQLSFVSFPGDWDVVALDASGAEVARASVVVRR